MAAEYVTRRAHAGKKEHPAGSRCSAERRGNLLVLTFGDGDVVELPGDRWFLEGLEPERGAAQEYWLVKGLSDLAAAEIGAEEDRRAVEALAAAGPG